MKKYLVKAEGNLSDCTSYSLEHEVLTSSMPLAILIHDSIINLLKPSTHQIISITEVTE